MISKKTKKGVDKMKKEKLEDVRDTAVKLETIYSQSPTDYAYLKGWIHCLLQEEEKAYCAHKPPKNRSA